MTELENTLQEQHQHLLQLTEQKEKELNQLKEEFKEYRAQSLELEEFLEEENNKLEEEVKEWKKKEERERERGKRGKEELKKVETELEKKEKMISQQKLVLDKLKIKMVELEQQNEDLKVKLRTVDYEKTELQEQSYKEQEKYILMKDQLEDRLSCIDDDLKSMRQSHQDLLTENSHYRQREREAIKHITILGNNNHANILLPPNHYTHKKQRSLVTPLQFCNSEKQLLGEHPANIHQEWHNSQHLNDESEEPSRRLNTYQPPKDPVDHLNTCKPSVNSIQEKQSFDSEFDTLSVYNPQENMQLEQLQQLENSLPADQKWHQINSLRDYVISQAHNHQVLTQQLEQLSAQNAQLALQLQVYKDNENLLNQDQTITQIQCENKRFKQEIITLRNQLKAIDNNKNIANNSYNSQKANYKNVKQQIIWVKDKDSDNYVKAEVVGQNTEVKNSSYINNKPPIIPKKNTNNNNINRNVQQNGYYMNKYKQQINYNNNQKEYQNLQKNFHQIKDEKNKESDGLINKFNKIMKQKTVNITGKYINKQMQ